MTNGNGVSRGDRNRNARLARLRELVPVRERDRRDRPGRQTSRWSWCATTTRRVLARRTFRCKAWDLGAALDWAADRAAAAGFAGVTVACEPTGHRWRVLGPARRGPGHVVRVCAADADVLGTPI